jgi:hypothetical protein
MSLLDNLFKQSGADIIVSPTTIEGDAPITPGFLYELTGTVSDITLTLPTLTLAAVTGKRIAIKVITSPEGGPESAGDVIVVVPDGMTIEGDDGAFIASSTITGGRSAPLYREWICTPGGVWLLVTPPVAAATVPPASTYENGGAEEISVAGLSGVLANAQPVAVAKAGVLVGVELLLNLIEGFRTKITATDDPTHTKVDLTFAETVADAATAFAWVSNAASIDMGAAHNFVASNTLTGNSTLTITGGVDGSYGVVQVKQDGTGSRTLGFSVAGRTQLRDLNTPDTNPRPTPNSLTEYHIYFSTVAGTAYYRVFVVYLQ